MLAFATTRLQKLQAAECCKCLSANGFEGFPDGQNAGKVSNLGGSKPTPDWVVAYEVDATYGHDPWSKHGCSLRGLQSAK
jgi:hypothetical protein